MLSFIPDIVGSTFRWCLGSSWFAFMSFSIELCSFRTSDTILFIKIEDGFVTSTIDTLRIRSSQERSFNWAFGNVIISDKSKQLFIVIIDSLITNDPIASIEVTDIFIIGLSFTYTPSLNGLLLCY